MVKIFDVICQLADDFLWNKSRVFHILVGFYPSKSVRAFSLLILISSAKLFLFAGPNWYLMHLMERAMYLNENIKRIFEIGSKVKKLWDVKHVYRW